MGKSRRFTLYRNYFIHWSRFVPSNWIGYDETYIIRWSRSNSFSSNRTTISCIFLSFTFFLNYEVFNTKVNLTAKIIYQSILSGFLGMALGMSLLLIALQKADAGIVATLSQLVQ